jgi:hypothetical protein
MDPELTSTPPPRIVWPEDAERFEISVLGHVRVPVASVDDQPGLIRSRRTASATRWRRLRALPFVAFLVAVLVWQVAVGHISLWLAAALGAAFIAGILGMSWLAGQTRTYGIATVEDGVFVFDRALDRETALRWTFPWPSMQRIEFMGGALWLADKARDGPARGRVRATRLSDEQARAVLSDRRCPLKDRVPPEIALRIGLAAKSP